MTSDRTSALRWAEAEFGSADLGHGARRSRLVEIAARAAQSPAGTVTEVFVTSKEREGTYRFVESDKNEVEEIERAALRACLERTKEMPFFFVPVDGSSLTLTDRKRTRDLGRIGNRVVKSCGLQVMTAMAVAPDGTPLGYCAQHYWARSDRARGAPRKRRFKEKESRYWLDVIGRVEAERASIKGTARPFYQLDRGGDFRQMLAWQATADAYVTIRANQDRSVRDTRGRWLWRVAGKAPRLGRFPLFVPGSPHRRERTATIEVRAKTVTVKLKRDADVPAEVTVNAVLAREITAVPYGEEPIEWLLLTNYPVKTFADACRVIHGYASRWRIEDFHRTWKTTCRVEDTQLRSAEAIQRWAVILAAVAIRVQRLTRLARTQPDLPASEELADDEVQALLALKNAERFGTGFVPSIGQAVAWIAELGGYTGKSSGGPPGAQVVGRGLLKVTLAADTVRALRAAKKI